MARDTANAILDGAALDQLMPMHLLLSDTGHIRRAGPTIAKLAGEEGLTGRRFLEVFELRRPRNISSLQKLRDAGTDNLSLRMRGQDTTTLRGQMVDLPDAAGGALVNLSFGISVVDAVGRFDLTSADFAPTDLTIEMLYLVEAKAAVMNESHKLNARLQMARVAAEEQAFTDTLTGLKNRRAMDHVLARYAATDQPFSVMHLDLDYFKAVNDTYGHAAGDHVLQVVARALVEETRADDTIVRAGGDEFVLIFPQLISREVLTDISKRILARLEAPIRFENVDCKISGSIGIAPSDLYPNPVIEVMLEDADRALYRSKNAGRAQHTFVDAISEETGQGIAAKATPETPSQSA